MTFHQKTRKIDQKGHINGRAVGKSYIIGKVFQLPLYQYILLLVKNQF